MAPIRRYLRITKYSVLECRIYLDNPALAHSWLLNPRDPVLPRVIEAVRPLVLPKLREEQERERSRKKNAKKRNIKDVVTGDDFEVSIFLTETSTRHSLLHKQKHVRDKTQTKLTSNSSRLTGTSREAPIDVGDDPDFPSSRATPALRLEESDDSGGGTALDAIPAIEDEEGAEEQEAPRRSKRRRPRESARPGDSGSGNDYQVIESSPSEDESGSSNEPETRRPKRRKDTDAGRDKGDDKKKLAIDISYEGFAIYGRVLCLVVKRRDVGSVGAGGSSRAKSGTPTSLSSRDQPQRGPGAGQAMMENWITSTQVPEGDDAEP